MTPDPQEDVATAVAELRRRAGLPIDPAVRGPVLLGRLFEECNLLHVSVPILTRAAVVAHLTAEGLAPDPVVTAGGPDPVLAGCLLVAGDDGFVFIGRREPVAAADGSPRERSTPQGRQRFTAGHELGHFVLHRGRMGRFTADKAEAIREGGDDDKIEAMEREANRFAVELLMPAAVCGARAEEFRKAYRVCPLQPFAYRLAAELLVSPEAMRYRLRELGVCDD